MSHAASAQPLSTGLEKDPLTLLSPITTKSASVPLTPVFEQSFSPVLLSSTTNAPANKTSAKSLSTTCLEVSMLAPSTSLALSHFEEDPPALSSPAIFAQSLSTDATYLSPVSLTTGPIEEDLQSPMILESLPSSHQEVTSTCFSSLSLSASLEENPPALLSATILAQSVSSSHQEACLSPVNFSQSMSTDGSPTFLPNTPTSTPSLANSMSTSFLIEAKCKEKKWVEHALALLDKGELNRGDYIGWAAYHASQQPSTNDLRCLCALLPLFYEKAATFAMIKHGMDVQRKAIQYLNPGQIPVTTFDQPLYALAKLVQWKWPVTYGESVYVVLLGGLHIEMALWNTLGDLLEASGWTTALTEAEVASPGTADSFLKVSHLTRTRHAHQVTFLTLKRLQKEAFFVLRKWSL